MKKEILEKWVEALRSGEYQQTVEALRDSTGFCCLGVLCDLYAKENHKQWEVNRVFNNYELTEIIYCLLGETACLPKEVLEWSGLNDKSPGLNFSIEKGESPTYELLAELNDKYRFSFNKIADLIENHYVE